MSLKEVLKEIRTCSPSENCSVRRAVPESQKEKIRKSIRERKTPKEIAAENRAKSKVLLKKLVFLFRVPLGERTKIQRRARKLLESFEGNLGKAQKKMLENLSKKFQKKTLKTREFETSSHFFWEEKEEDETLRVFALPREEWENFLENAKKGFSEEDLDHRGIVFAHGIPQEDLKNKKWEKTEESLAFRDFLKEVRAGKEKNWTPGKLNEKLQFFVEHEGLFFPEKTKFDKEWERKK